MTPASHFAAVLAGLLPFTLGSAAPASADPMTLALFAAADVWVDSRTATTATVCARGWVDDGVPTVGTWHFRVIGTTSSYTDSRGGATYPKTCYPVSTNGTAVGATDASLVYIGVGGDVLASCTAVLHWSPSYRIDGLVGGCTGIPTVAGATT